MTFILNFALHVLIGFMLVSLFSLISDSDKRVERDEYLNILPKQTFSLKFVIYCAYTYIAVFLLSFLLPVLTPLLSVIFAVESLFAWGWLIETARAGKLQVWYEDLKAKFASK